MKSWRLTRRLKHNVQAPLTVYSKGHKHMKRLTMLGVVLVAVPIVSLFLQSPLRGVQNSKAQFNVMETTIQDIHNAYKAGKLTAHQLVQMYLDRIQAYDKQGPQLNAIITLNPKALEEADRLDAAFKSSG